VMSIPTIITGFYGMNVTVPGAENSFTYLAILTGILVISVIVIYLFNKRNWF